MTRVRARKQAVVAGWRETVFLPDLEIGPIIAKLDTGARTAALHAANIKTYQSDDGQRVQFDAFIDHAKSHAQTRDMPVFARRKVKNTGGNVEERIVIQTRIKLGDQSWLTEINLTDRSDMVVPMLLGRSTIKRRFLVHPSKTFLLTTSKRKRTSRES